ncbi:MAG TPA: DUF5666 domain-containing protein [Steroidobacteraceae bacterium]|nr:DUF5666 domain-containing protein [Steroidobacteraceae bacterium]
MAKSLRSFSRRGSVGITSAFAIAVALVGGSVQAGELAFGPVQQVHVRASTIVVLGHTFHIGDKTRITNGGKPIALRSISPGTLVSVNGVEAVNGSAQVRSVMAAATVNVPGATRLLIAGVVRGVSAAGTIQLGRLTVDVNQTLNGDGALPAVGSFVNLVGTQPVLNGIFLASSVASTPGSISGDSVPGSISGDGIPGSISGDSAPRSISGDGIPGSISGDSVPGSISGDSIPGSISGDRVPGSISGD